MQPAARRYLRRCPRRFLAEGWNLVIDINPPLLSVLVIQGNVTIDPTTDVTISATYIIVMGKGSLKAGTLDVPHPRALTILLNGSRSTPDYAVDNKLNLGSKVLAALRGGSIELYGRQVCRCAWLCYCEGRQGWTASWRSIASFSTEPLLAVLPLTVPTHSRPRSGSS